VRALGNAGSVQPITSALADEHPLVRVAAVRALARLGLPETFAAISQAFQDDDWRVRESVILSLSELQPTAPLLTVALNDPSTDVRAAAATASVVDTAEAVPGATVAHRITQMCRHVALVCVAQRKLIHPGVWLVSGAIMLATGAFGVTAALATPTFSQSASVLVTVASMLCAAIAIAFVADARHDASREIPLATSTSPGVILLCRGALATAYVALWSLAVSGALALALGASWLSLITLWAAPLATLAALALALTVVAGSVFSVAGSAALVALQACRVSLAHGLTVSFDAHFWSLSPLTLVATLVALTIAVIVAQHPHLSEMRG
jgi:hypothetical protein